MPLRITLVSIFSLILISSGVLFAAHLFENESLVEVLLVAKDTIVSNDKKLKLVFVGDIMLARDVERRLLLEDTGYMLKAIRDRLQGDMVIANFEASVPEVHIPTKSMEMRFSVQPDLATELAFGGFTHASLANNHALDYGLSGYQNTIKVIESLGIKAAGHPSRVSTSSLFMIQGEGRQAAVVNINATYGYPDLDLVVSALPQGLEEDDLLVAYIHWGEEYELRHNEAQQNFAHALIDSGFDLIVGHHPHVVQDIELYRDSLIFYSLGNFVFDQYWQPEVQQGLLLGLTESYEGWELELVPVETASVHVQPREMVGEEREAFLSDLAGRSSSRLTEDIMLGVVSLQF